MNDTIFALSSGRPPAAIAIVRISGSRAHTALEQLAGPLPEPRQATLRRLRSHQSGELLDEAIVLRFDAPHSATGEDLVELHCHGGRAVIDAVQRALAAIDGLREAEPGEFTRRAFHNGRIDLTEAEGLGDLLQAETESQRRAALAVAEGGLSQQIEEWQARVLALSAMAERAIDYGEEGIETSDESLRRDCAALALELQGWIARPRAEPLRDGLKVVIAGPPNAGKSSLINAIVGHERAIVTDRPGTTRDHIEVPIALGGIPVVLVDTAGLRDSGDEVETIGIERAAKLAEAADILLWMGDPAHAPSRDRTILIQGKADLPGRESGAPGTVALSSITGRGVGVLLEQVIELAKQLLPADDAIALNRRQAGLVEDASNALADAASQDDPVLIAEDIRAARLAFDRLTGRAGFEDVLDALFARFCLGK